MRLSDENTREDRHLMPEERIALQAEEIKRLWQENEQLQAQVARMREALRKAGGAIKAAWSDGSVSVALNKACEALAAIDKVIGGGINGWS